MNNESRLREIEKCEELLEFENLTPMERRSIEAYRTTLKNEKNMKGGDFQDGNNRRNSKEL